MLELRKGRDGKEYKVTDSGTWYHKDTTDTVIQILENARRLNYVVRLFYGDPATGRDWLEENDVHGRIGRSMGPIKIPILLANVRSLGGGGILTDRIIRIQWRTRTLVPRLREWKTDNYQSVDLVVLRYPSLGTFAVIKRGDSLEEYLAAFPYHSKAQRWADFMMGRRMNK